MQNFRESGNGEGRRALPQRPATCKISGWSSLGNYFYLRAAYIKQKCLLKMEIKVETFRSRHKRRFCLENTVKPLKAETLWGIENCRP